MTVLQFKRSSDITAFICVFFAYCYDCFFRVTVCSIAKILALIRAPPGVQCLLESRGSGKFVYGDILAVYSDALGCV